VATPRELGDSETRKYALHKPLLRALDADTWPAYSAEERGVVRARVAAARAAVGAPSATEIGGDDSAFVRKSAVGVAGGTADGPAVGSKRGREGEGGGAERSPPGGGEVVSASPSEAGGNGSKGGEKKAVVRELAMGGAPGGGDGHGAAEEARGEGRHNDL